MSKINMNNVNRIIEKHRSFYRDMLKKHYIPILKNYIKELMQELNIENYTTHISNDESVYLHLYIHDNDFQIHIPEEPYGNTKYMNNDKGWKLFNYIENDLYEQEKNRAKRNKSRKR